MIWPVRRCHHRSGSLKRERTVRTARAIKFDASITGKESGLLNLLAAESRNLRSLLLHQILDQSVEIGSGDIEAPGRQGLVAVALGDGLLRQLDLVVAQLILEGSRGQRIAQAEQAGLLQIVR